MPSHLTIHPICNNIQQQHSNAAQHQRQCRICFQDGKPENRLIQPCDCKGSVSFIHEQCLYKWVATITQQKQNPTRMKCQGFSTYSIKCQMCHAEIYFQINRQLACKTWSEMCQYLQSYPFFYTVEFIAFLCTLVMIIFLSFWYSKKPDYSLPENQANKKQQYLWLILLIVIILLSIGACKAIWDFTIGLFIYIRNSQLKISDKSIKLRQQITQMNFHREITIEQQQ